jgi:hypothetical protein
MTAHSNPQTIMAITKLVGNRVPYTSKTPILSNIARILAGNSASGSPYAYPKSSGADVSYHGMYRVVGEQTPTGTSYRVESPTNVVHTTPDRHQAVEIAERLNKQMFGT